LLRRARVAATKRWTEAVMSSVIVTFTSKEMKRPGEFAKRIFRELRREATVSRMIQTKAPKRLATLLVALAFVGCDEPKPAPSASPPASAIAAAVTAPSAVATAAPAASSAMAVAPPVPAATYDIDMSHSRVTFSVRHMMVSNTRGQFGKFSGTAFIDEANPGASKVNLEIDTVSIDTSDAKRDEHLRGADFFDVKQFPKMTFRSTQVERVGAGWKVTGDLTIRATTKPVVLDVDSISPVVKDPWGGVRRGTRARAKIDRKAFGLVWNKALETGGAVVGDEVTLDLEVELLEKKTP
jgi:polyisoprenoid-binding protein YceI